MSVVKLKKLKADDFQDYIKENKLTDKNLISFLEKKEIEKKDLSTYQQYLEDSGNTTLNLSSITQKAGNALKSFSAALGSMLTMWALGKGIEFLITELDNAADSVADVEDRIRENQDALSDYTSKIDELTEKLQNLNKTDTAYLSDAEKTRLETETAYIESQLELYDQLAAAKEKAVNEDYIKAASGKNEEVAIKKLWAEVKNGKWKEAAYTLDEANDNIAWYDFMLDQSVAEYQKILNTNAYEVKYSGFSDLQRDLTGIRDAIKVISSDLNDIPLLDPLLKGMDGLLQDLKLLESCSLSDIFDLSDILSKNKLDEINGYLQTLRETLSSGEYLDSLRNKLSDAVPHELLENPEKLQNIIVLISSSINILIQRIGDKTGLSEILTILKERLNDISGVFSGFISKFGFIFEDAINAWNEAHQADYSDFSAEDTDHKVDTANHETDFSSPISRTIDRLSTQLKPAFDSLKSAIDKLNSMEDADISIGYSSFENLARVLTDTSSTADDVKNSMNALANAKAFYLRLRPEILCHWHHMKKHCPILIMHERIFLIGNLWKLILPLYLTQNPIQPHPT